MNYFLKDIALYLYHHKNGDFRNMIVVFPGRRASLFFNYFLSQLSEKPFWAPRYLTISELVQELCGFQIADPLTLVFRLYHVFKKITGSGESFDSFYNYCEIIINDFDDIDKYGVDAKSLFTNLADLKAIEDQWSYLDPVQLEIIRNFWKVIIKSKDSKEKQKFITIWESLYDIYIGFAASLESDGLVYEGRAYRKALEGTSAKFEGYELAFVGFNALSHCEELLFDSFRKQKNTLFFWDYDEIYVDDTVHEAGFFLRKYIHRFPHPGDFNSSAHRKQEEQKVTVLSVPLAISQAKIVGKCMSLLESDAGSSPLDTALLLADESLLAPVVNSLSDDLADVNISMGYPVIDTPAHGFFDSLIELHKNKKKKEGSNVYLYHHHDFFAILGHPFLQLQNDPSYQKFRSDCIRKNLVYIDPSILPFNNVVADFILKGYNNKRTFGGHVLEIIDKIISTAGEIEQNMHSRWQIEILFAIRKMITRFDALISTADMEISFQVMLNILKQMLRKLSVPFSGEPLKGLQIIGILETRTLDFENIIMLAMNEGSFPKTGHIPSMIPYSLREGFGLPTLRHQDAIFGYYFYRLLHRAKNIILVYNSQEKGLQRGEPSRFISQLQYERKIPAETVYGGYKSGLQRRKTLTAKKSDIVYEKLFRYQDSEKKDILSPSALNTYINCSLKFYFRYIEQIREPESVTERIEGDVFGMILHKIMADLYKPFTGRVCSREDIIRILDNKELLDQVIDNAFSSEYFNETVTKKSFKGRNLIVRDVISKYAEGILNFDSRGEGFTMISSEKKFDTVILPANQEIPVRLGGFIDRVDMVNDVVRIIDYKTGKGNNDFQDIKSLFSSDNNKRNSGVFQVFLYSWVFLKNKKSRLQPMLYHVRSIFDENFTPVIVQAENRSRITINNFEEQFQEFEDCLQGLVDEIFNKEIPFIQTANSAECGHCPFKEICLKEVRSYT